jgi:hypothetical protein
MDQLNQLLGLFGGDQGRAAQLLTWFVTAQTLFKLIGGHLQSFLERALAAVVSSKETDDDTIAARILAHPAYRFTAWLVDVTTRLKLPRELPTTLPTGTAKLPLVLLLGFVVFASGCATQRTLLTETVAADGAYTKTTDIRTCTFWDSKSELAKLKTSSTDKTQSVGLSGLAQESDSSNTVLLVERAVEAAVRGAVSGAVPK